MGYEWIMLILLGLPAAFSIDVQQYFKDRFDDYDPDRVS
jgi:hypothetical protein